MVGWAGRVLSLAFGTGKALEKNNYYPKGSVGARVQDLHSIALFLQIWGPERTMQSAVPSTIPALPRKMPECTLVALPCQLTHSALVFSMIGNAPLCGLSGSAQEAVINNYQFLRGL